MEVFITRDANRSYYYCSDARWENKFGQFRRDK